jgi:o-succinylbenzoate synthase
VIRAFSTTRFRLPLATRLATAHGTIGAREGVLLALADDGGVHGFGEAMPLPGFGLEGVDEAERALAAIGAALAAAGELDLAAALALAAETAPAAAAARAAADCALHDLHARRAGCSVAALLAGGRGTHAVVPASGLVAAAAPQAAAGEARRLVARGHRALKLKIGGDADADLARVAAVRAAVGSRTALRLDANGAWSEDEAALRLEALARFAPELVEEPLRSPEPEAWRRLGARSAVPLAADESIRGFASARTLLAAGAVRWLIVKPAAVGGLAPARAIALAAPAAGAGTVVTSFLDSALGRAAARELAASLPGPLAPAGIATGRLLAADLAALPDGAVCAAAPLGLGVAPDRALLVRAAGAAAGAAAA